MKGKNSPEKLLTAISKLDAVEFLGVCKILGLKLYDEEEINPKKFEAIWEEMCDMVWSMNRTRRRNLGKLIYAATGKEEK